MKHHPYQYTKFTHTQRLIQTQVASLALKVISIASLIAILLYSVIHLRIVTTWLETNQMVSYVMDGLMVLLLGLIIYDGYLRIQIKHYHHLIKASLKFGLLILGGAIIVISVIHSPRIMFYIANNKTLNQMIPWLILLLCGLIGYALYLKSKSKK